ncbi:TetR/AcrR family transcriptional regulator C-terminal domain-containing protein [Crossiella sp. SN42]|uniref:TetR/AcrR family transcriptional regulator C-terminal domain-containing protein n=1 Tax=Crossiella sp. SN42 TaxID=2944808 RepID=UPI00207C4A8F|nr:TetR/AcrR family transcriptional regulator C-terminal domain-containing protein [Crossiella sp. SN42]MCO1577386.1 TetR/AcrR family transcriptional regulator C-terminal domain-containing protein [Crossiella sp. SN42]
MTRREPLNREKVLDAALALAGKEGLDGLSMRKLAKSLGVEAMALYNHVANKTDILDGIAARVYAEIERPDPALPWAERVRATALSFYRVLSRHPVVPLALVTDQANPTTLRALQPMDDLIGALYEAGLDDDGVRQALGALNGLIFGSLLLTTAGFARAHSEPAETGHTEIYLRRVDPAKLPHFSRALPALGAPRPEQDFERALDLLLTGLIAAAPS